MCRKTAKLKLNGMYNNIFNLSLIYVIDLKQVLCYYKFQRCEDMNEYY